MKFNLPALAPAIEISKNVLEWVDIRLLIILYLQIPILILTIIFFGLMVLTLNNNKQIMEKIDVITSDSVLFKKD